MCSSAPKWDDQLECQSEQKKELSLGIPWENLSGELWDYWTGMPSAQ